MPITFPYPICDDLLQKSAKIKLAIFDVDGVLTDAKLYYNEDKECLKVFHALDGHGIKMLQSQGIAVAIITARNSDALKKRMQDLHVEFCFYGIKNKSQAFAKLLAQTKLTPQQCCYMGDDVIDISVMQQCALRFAPKNAHFSVQQSAHWVSPFEGGNGAVRSICDILLYASDPTFFTDFFTS